MEEPSGPAHTDTTGGQQYQTRARWSYQQGVDLKEIVSFKDILEEKQAGE